MLFVKYSILFFIFLIAALIGNLFSKKYRNRVEEFAKDMDIPCTNVETIKEAVPAAVKVATEGDTILLSPASASWDQYKKFEDRGDEFKQLIDKL